MARLIQRGDVRWYRFGRPDKQRPVVILTRTAALEFLAEVTVAPVTSTIRDIPTEVVLTRDDGMPRTCAANLDHVQTVSRAKVGALLTRLHADRMAQVGGALRFALDVVSAWRLHRTLVVVQVAVCLVVVFGAGLLTQTLRTLATVDLGFEADKVIALRVDPSAGGHPDARVSEIFDEMLARVRVLPGVTAASLASSPPHGAMSVTMGIEVPGYDPVPERGDTVVGFNFVSSRYFETLGQPVIRGRDFDERDSRGRPLAAVVNETFVEHYFDGGNPLGRRFRQGREELEIVGVVADSSDQSIRSGPADTVYIHEEQGPRSGMTLLARAGEAPERVVPSLFAMIRSIDRRMPVAAVHTLDVDIEAGISSERMLGYLSTLFAVLTLLLVGIGLYGVLASAVVRRTREIGLRLALGAGRGSVVLLLGREGAVLLIAGVFVGGFLALAGGQVLRGVLFGVAATDPLTMIGSILVLIAAALLATAVPLRRAVRVDPMIALRSE